jgi:hypothetical protein
MHWDPIEFSNEKIWTQIKYIVLDSIASIKICYDEMFYIVIIDYEILEIDFLMDILLYIKMKMKTNFSKYYD